MKEGNTFDRKNIQVFFLEGFGEKRGRFVFFPTFESVDFFFDLGWTTKS